MKSKAAGGKPVDIFQADERFKAFAEDRFLAEDEVEDEGEEDDEEDDEDEDEDEDEDDEEDDDNWSEDCTNEVTKDNDDDDDKRDSAETNRVKTTKSCKKNERLKKESKKYKENLEKRGVMYLSRIPPFMKPNKVRALLEVYGEITRLYLSEEDKTARKRRKLSGGNGSKQFVEGWVEFADKKIAKSVALSLNNTNIAPNKGDFYHDDRWNIKYLKKFKWEYLTEKFAYERRVREQKLNAAMLKAKKVNQEFVEKVEKDKTEKHIKNRINAKGTESGNSKSNGRKRNFFQTNSLGSNHGENRSKIKKSLLTEIFTK